MSRLTDQMDQSAAWLADQRNKATGGWGAEGPSSPESTMNTAEAIIALIDADADAVDGDAVRDGLAFLRGRQAQSGEPEPGSWRREVEDRGVLVEHADVVRTGLAIEALLRAGQPVHDSAIVAAVRWLYTRQNADGGWGCTPGGQTRILQTCSALDALMAVLGAVGATVEERRGRGADLVDRVERGLR
jgi:prenyltransferase beta subunit